jgi:serine/threonine protein phosphatase PrpC
MLSLVQKELGIQPNDDQIIASAVQHVEEASGISMKGTLKERLQNVAVELGVVRVSGPRIADGLSGSMVPQLAKLQSQMDQVLGLLTGHSQREEMQQMVKAVGVYERMAESRREASRMNATKDARRKALPQRPTVAIPVATVQSEPSPTPQPSSLVDRLLEAKKKRAVEQEKAEAAERSGIPPPPPSNTYQPVQQPTCLQTATQLLQRALTLDKTTNPNNHDSLVMAAAALTRAQKALLKALEPGNHPEEAKAILQEKLRHVRKRILRYIKSVSQTELNAAVMFFEGEVTDEIGGSWARCFAQVVGYNQVESKENVLYRFNSDCPSLHMGKLRSAFATQVFTETSVASDCHSFLFAAVFDGHDGRQCAEFAQSRLWPGFQRHFHISGGNPVVAFQRAFYEIESGFGRAFSDEPSSLFAAACAAAIFIDVQSRPKRICVANIGTCRVVHSCGKQIGATQLTAEHSCENLSERLRIRHQHPDALHNNSQKGLLGLYAHTRALGGMHMKDRRVADVWNTRHFRRVHPLPGTILTNAIGQRRDVAPYLTSRVGVSSTDLEEGDFVIVATSCFWQCFANEDAVLLASKLLAGAREAGASLTNIAQAMLAECKAPDGGDLDDIALLLLTADGISTAAHNNRDFLVGGVSIQPQPAPAAVPEPESAVTKEACKRGQISSQPPPPPPAIPSKPVSLQTVSRLRERRGAVTATGASGRLLNTPTAEPLRLSPPPLLKPSDPHRLKSTLGAIEGVSKSAKMPAQQLRSSEIERNRLAADPTISRLRIRRGAVTTIGSGGPRSIGADHDRAKTRSLEQPTPTPIQAHHMGRSSGGGSIAERPPTCVC